MPRKVQTLARKVGQQPLPTLKSAPAAPKKMVAPETTVLRMICAKDFMGQQDYTQVRANPKRFLQTRQLLVKDVWELAEEERFGKAVVGLTRVAKTHEQQFMQDSSKGGIFLEPTAASRQPARIKWVERGQGELPTEYLDCVRALRPALGALQRADQLGCLFVVRNVLGQGVHQAAPVTRNNLQGASLRKLAVFHRLLLGRSSRLILRRARLHLHRLNLCLKALSWERETRGLLDRGALDRARAPANRRRQPKPGDGFTLLDADHAAEIIRRATMLPFSCPAHRRALEPPGTYHSLRALRFPGTSCALR